MTAKPNRCALMPSFTPLSQIWSSSSAWAGIGAAMASSSAIEIEVGCGIKMLSAPIAFCQFFQGAFITLFKSFGSI